MPLPEPVAGLVIRYAYLWQREQAADRDTGSKARPCAIVLSIDNPEDRTEVVVVPITHSPPLDATWSISMPPGVKRHLGLDPQPSWVVATEANVFAWPGPDLEPISPHEPDRFDYGMLPPRFFEQVRTLVLRRIRERRLATVRRSE